MHASLSSLVIVIVAAFLTPLLLHRFRLHMIPVVVAEIIVGIIIGKTGFNIVEQDMWLETLSTLGFLFLMFLSGLEIDFSAFANKKKGKEEKEPNAFFVASIVFVGIFLVSLALSYIFVWLGYIDNAFLMTLIISTISLGVVVPTLKDAQLMKTTIGQTILLIAVIADLATMVLLAVFVSMHDPSHGNVWLLLGLFLVGVIFYFAGKYFKKRSFIETMAKGTIQIGTRAVFALIIVLVALSETLGAENILGAFLAGVLVSLLAPNQDFVHKLDSFGYGFFIPIFFVMVGVNLDLRPLFTQFDILLLIPLLFVALVVSKVVPVYMLRIWYDRNTTLAAGFLLVSTLSLVIAAATIAERMGMIDENMKGALILVAVLTSVVSPIMFKKLYRVEKEERKKMVKLIGTNQFTLAAVRDLSPDEYETTLYHIRQDKIEQTEHIFPIVDIDDYSFETLQAHEALTADVVVVLTGNEQTNAQIATWAKEQGTPRVIAFAESPSVVQQLKSIDVETISLALSAGAMLKALIESPNVVHMLTQRDIALHEIEMNNLAYHGVLLRQFPFLGDCIIVRIFRGHESIVPHGDTEMRMGDRMIVTGSEEYVKELRELLERKY
ncbi:monovalent cation:proton antiporter family protein [Anoxybacillus flavithermus]|uniref:monovalent cation:proton antiporter family protein n=1 Tax=Anoxybacillus flavithermus TaxID=33934 RepID=UPI001867F2C3|nr:monovalent cation:proton antiporter family protein [Anoxybacillus flavithermus]MBE2941263.1 monovalent cation:proton antiporter family protein [Anoxybacillus flavithermus]MBE2942281.1 monovalent cation:proton antiporter family protein [Anoxybacillus flavithermus]MBE2950383.1 monovalent cation:proton antiporter family protein [Anoxybacillus flavithermus]MBE2953177.1 monovalent cation:proton antiporter family protein [Anoxybacillus flavithermus]MBE2958396.1 monovalent cation:proton antiporter